jgi:recombination protein RecT
MKDGATSKVVILNRSQVMAAKAKSDGRNSEFSPWNPNEEAMWLKTAARRLAKWVPTSAEFMREQLRAQAEVAAELPTGFAPALPQPQADIPDDGDDAMDEDGPIEGELVDDEPAAGWPEAAQPGSRA